MVSNLCCSEALADSDWNSRIKFVMETMRLLPTPNITLVMYMYMYIYNRVYIVCTCTCIYTCTYTVLASYPSPSHEKGERGPGIHCLYMREIIHGKPISPQSYFAFSWEGSGYKASTVHVHGEMKTPMYMYIMYMYMYMYSLHVYQYINYKYCVWVLLPDNHIIEFSTTRIQWHGRDDTWSVYTNII